MDGQKAQPKYDEKNQANDPNKDKSGDMNKRKEARQFAALVGRVTSRSKYFLRPPRR